MSDQPCNPKWTVDTTREHVLAILKEHDRRYEQRFVSSEKALELAAKAVELAAQSKNQWFNTALGILALVAAIVIPLIVQLWKR